MPPSKKTFPRRPRGGWKWTWPCLVTKRAGSPNGVVAWCLEVHDLWISKAVAGRPKDREFCRTLAEAGLVQGNVLRERLAATVRLDGRVRAHVEGWIRA